MNNLEQLKAFVTSVSQKHMDKLHALLEVTEKHYNLNRKMVDDVMNLAGNDAKNGFSILKTNAPDFVKEMMSLR